MGYESIKLLRPVRVDALVTVHYFEYASDYCFEGERHDFWEFLYVDKGEVDVVAGEELHRLTRGQIIFHRPGEFHALRANGVTAPDLVVVSFLGQGEEMAFFEELVTSLGDPERALLARIVEEGGAAFSTPLDDPLTTVLVRRETAPFGAEALVACALEELLIRLRRRAGDVPDRPGSLIHAHTMETLFDRVERYLMANLSRRLTLEQVCRDNLASRSRLQQIFRERTGGGVMERFGVLKVKAAQGMIREGGRNFTEIAAALGYQSIHYFSRHFKKCAGMTPSEYASSVKVLTTKRRVEE